MKRRVLMGVAGALAGVLVAVAGVLLTAKAPEAAPNKGTRAERLRAERLPAGLDALKALARPKGAPGPHDWLAQHDEPGQTLKEWQRGDPVKVTASLKALYVVRIGEVTPAQKRILELTREFLALHFQVPVYELAPIEPSEIPKEATRLNPISEELQFNSEWILENLLPPKRPKDGVALMALTATDLWPGPGWNFVFGQASTTQRVGVWSIARHGDPETQGKLALLRTLKVAAHEAGHMFTLHHCIAFECLMNGGNHLGETDHGPLEPCPVCLAKQREATGAELHKRYAALKEFFTREGLSDEAAFMEKSAAALSR